PLMPADSVAIAIASAGSKHDAASVRSLRGWRETSQVSFVASIERADWLSGSGNAAARDRGLASTTRVVLVSSMGRWHGMHFSGGYNASKAALSIWGESLDMELRQRGNRRFTVTVVEPGIFVSEMSRPTPLTRMLFVSRKKVAVRILAGALAGRSVIRPPRWFALLTWA